MIYLNRAVYLAQASCLILVAILPLIKADLNSGIDDGDSSLDSATGGSAMKHSDEILNSLPKMPEVTTKPPVGKLQIGIKKKVENCDYQAQKGDRLHMHYKGSLKDGTEFDNSYTRGEPLAFNLGTGQVIKGWDQGLLGICAGEKRKLVIPPHLAYGESGSGATIPPDSTLVFEVEAVKIEKSRRQDL